MRASTVVAGVSTTALVLLLVGDWVAPLREHLAIAASKDCAICDDPESEESCPAEYTLSRKEIESFALQSALDASSEPSRYLMLSGGGSRGAWGAGILNAWYGVNEKGDTPPKSSRPYFDMVTGISTGALQVTPVYLNEQDAEKELRAAYRDVTNADITSGRWPPPWKDLDPLKENLRDKWATNDMIDAVADQYDETGREIVVGTVNLDSGEFCAWDMGKIALAEQYDLYREVLLASAANPGAWLAPQRIERSLHGDGGVRHGLFVKEHVVPLLSAHAEAVSQGADPPEVYLVVNAKLGITGRCVSETGYYFAKTSPVMRSLKILMNEARFGALFRIEHAMSEIGWQPRFLAIPECPKLAGQNGCVSLPDSDDFDGNKMQPVHDAGWQLYEEKGAGVWESTIPETGPWWPASCKG